MNQLSPNDSIEIPSKTKALSNYAVTCFARGDTLDEIRSNLIDHGCDDEKADSIIASLGDRIKNAEKNRPQIVNEAKSKTRLKGFLWFSGGFLTSFVSYTAAPQIDGSYLIFSGAMIYGLYLFVASFFLK